MPWASKAQSRWGHSVGKEALGGSAKVAEWDAATPKGSLSETAKSRGAKKEAPKEKPKGGSISNLFKK